MEEDIVSTHHNNNDHLLSVCPEQLHIINTVVQIQGCGDTDTNWSAGHYTEIWLIPCPHVHTHTHTHTHTHIHTHTHTQLTCLHTNTTAVARSCTVDGCNTNSVVCTINEVSNSGHGCISSYTPCTHCGPRGGTDVVTECIEATRGWGPLDGQRVGTHQG